jgi:CPA2 family monovalent cation:H+ antiporter-2
MFSAIFFVSVGLLFNPDVLIQYFMPILVITLAVVFGKVFTCSLGVFISGRSGKTSMRVGMGLAQIGEFSFIIASLGIALNITGQFLYSIAVAVSIITTLITPYLIKYSDKTTDYLSQLLPTKLQTILGLYSTWMHDIQPQSGQKILTKAIKNCFINIAVNFFIVTAIFLCGAYLASTEMGDMLIKVTNENIQNTIIWSIALVLSLPFLIAAYRKTKALSMILAELSLKTDSDTRLTINVRKIISQVIPIFFIIGILLFISALSTSILPPMELLLIIFVIAAILIALLFPFLIKLHARLQISLMETINKKDDSQP